MATGTLTPTPYQTVLDANGNPLPGAKITTYLAGTTTLAATYTDVALTVANQNPILADSAGRYVAYLSPGSSYKFAITDAANATVRTQDNIGAVPPTSINLDVTGTAGEALTAGQPAYLSDGSGGKTAGSWYRGDASNAYSSIAALVGMVPAAIAQGATGTVRLSGQVSGLAGLVIGTTYYISGTPGSVTSTAPTNRRALGVADTTSSLVLQTGPSTVGAPWTVVTTTSTGTVNDFAPGLLGNTILRCNNATLLTINGLTGGYDGQRVTIISIGAGQVDLPHQAAGSSAGNRLLNVATSGATSLAAGSGIAEYVYDATTARYRLVNHEQGADITRTFAAGNYTATSGTWTVASAVVDAYRLRGREVTYRYNVSGTTSTTPASVQITLPGGFTSTNNATAFAFIANDGAAAAQGGSAGSSSALVAISRYTGNYTAGTVSVRGEIALEVT